MSYDFYFVDVIMVFDVVNVLIDVSVVIEVYEIGKVVDMLLLNWLIVFEIFLNWGEFFIG